MRHSLVSVACVAVASSIVTVTLYEALRGSPLAAPSIESPQAPIAIPAADSTEKVETVAPLVVPREEPTDVQIRLAELELRIASLETDTIPDRQPVKPDVEEEERRIELREQVMEWIAQEREERQQANRIQHEAQRQTELEFSVRHQASVLADENNLNTWQEDTLFDVLLEIEGRRREIEESVDLKTDTPEIFEARWTEFDEWADRRLREELGAGLIEQMFGED